MMFDIAQNMSVIGIIITLLLTGAVSGFLAGLLGVGGGIVMVRILAYVLEASGIYSAMVMHVAIGSSLAIIVPTSLISARTHYRLGNVDYDVIRRLGPSVFIGALGGAVVASYFDNDALQVIFGVLASLIGLPFLTKMFVIQDGLPSAAPRSVLGAGVGIVSALVGIGGGSLTVPTLVACGWQMRRAVGTSALMGLVVAIPGMISFIIVGFGTVDDLPYAIGFVWLPGVFVISLAAYFTTPLGAKASSRLDHVRLRRIFGLFLMVLGMRLVYSGYNGSLPLFGG